MGTFPTAVTQQPPQQEGAPPQPGGASPVVKSTMLLASIGDAIRGLPKMFPNGQQGIDMMLKGLQMIQSSAAAASSPQQAPAPPR